MFCNSDFMKKCSSYLEMGVSNAFCSNRLHLDVQNFSENKEISTQRRPGMLKFILKTLLQLLFVHDNSRSFCRAIILSLFPFGFVTFTLCIRTYYKNAVPVKQNETLFGTLCKCKHEMAAFCCLGFTL